MFLKKYDQISEEQIVAIGITAATICYIVEQKLPPRGAAEHVKYINDAVENVLKNINRNPTKETLVTIQVVASSLVGDQDRFISRRAAKFQGGDKGVSESEIQQAIKICEKSVREFTGNR
jgi:pantoate kinase